MRVGQGENEARPLGGADRLQHARGPAQPALDHDVVIVRTGRPAIGREGHDIADPVIGPGVADAVLPQIVRKLRLLQPRAPEVRRVEQRARLRQRIAARLRDSAGQHDQQHHRPRALCPVSFALATCSTHKEAHRRKERQQQQRLDQRQGHRVAPGVVALAGFRRTPGRGPQAEDRRHDAGVEQRQLHTH